MGEDSEIITPTIVNGVDIDHKWALHNAYAGHFAYPYF